MMMMMMMMMLQAGPGGAQHHEGPGQRTGGLQHRQEVLRTPHDQPLQRDQPRPVGQAPRHVRQVRS